MGFFPAKSFVLLGVSRMVGVVKRSELRRMKATSLSEVLERSASIDIRQRVLMVCRPILTLGEDRLTRRMSCSRYNHQRSTNGHHNLNIPVVLDAVSV